MKIKYSKVRDTLQNLMGVIPSHAELARVFNSQGLSVTANALSNRLSNDGFLKDEEVIAIEKQYIIDLSISSVENNVIEIDYIHINPSCGTGTVVLDDADVTPVKIGKEIIKDLWKASPENLKLFKASGDSMESTITDGDVLLVDVSRVDFNNGGIFVLTINNEWFVKRLRLRVTGELDIISDNTKYETETLKPNSNIEIKVVGRVIKNLSRGL